VQALQVFDSWAGALGRADYREFALPHSSRIFSALRKTGVPVVHFGVGTTAILPDMTEAGGDVIGLDWRLPLDEAWLIVGHNRAVQGNLDPTLLLGPRDRLFAATDDVLRRAAGRAGHIFNLGHGVLPNTPLEQVQALAKHVHEFKL
jgi:uroporphyrinogen decarboxylase